MAGKLVLPDGYEKEEQASRVAEMLLDGETLYGVFDCNGRGTGFVGITDYRVIARDDGRRGKERHIASIPYSRIHSLSVESDKGWVFANATLAFGAGDDFWSFEFRAPERAHRAYQRIMSHLLDLPLRS